MGNFNPNNPAKHVGTDQVIIFFVTRNRAPTGADYRKPETGRNYTIGHIWQVGKNPTTGSEGDLWILSKIVANVAYWIQISSGVIPVGGILTLSDTADTLVYPNPAVPVGNIKLSGTSGQINVLADPVTHKLTWSLPGNLPAVQSFQVTTAVAPGVNPVTSSGGLITFTASQINQIGTPIQTITRALNTMSVEVQKAGSSTTKDITKNGLSHFNSGQFNVDEGFVTLIGGTTPAVLTLSDDVNALASPSGTGNIQLVGHVFKSDGTTKIHTTVTGTNLININPMSASRWIVDPKGFNGTHTTISSALLSASPGDTIFIFADTYVENLTLRAGINLTGYTSDRGTILIQGKATANFAGVGGCTLANVDLQAIGDFCLVVSGASASTITLNNCTFIAATNSCISFTNSDANSTINLQNCDSDTANAGITYYISSSPGNINILYSNLSSNSGNSTTPSTNSAGKVNIYNSLIGINLSTSGTGVIRSFNSTYDTTNQNTVNITTAGNGVNILQNNSFTSGTASSLSVGAGTTVYAANNVVKSNAVSTFAFIGAGTINTAGNVCTGTAVVNNVTTINALTVI